MIVASQDWQEYVAILEEQLRLTQIDARTDPLTDLPNRRALEEAIIEFDGKDMTVGMIDIDSFKQINDRYGHQAGDEVLRNVGASIQNCVRLVDFGARYGGDEFIILLVDCPLGDAWLVAKRIQEYNSDWSLVSSMRYTVTVGLAQRLPNEAIGSVIRRADAAMLQAKAEGRNRIGVCQEILEKF